MAKNETVFSWLEQNGYADVVETINAQKKKWAEQGSKTRRNWWDVLSGGANGKPRVIAGVEFPVLAAAQKRQGKPVTANAMMRNTEQSAPEINTNHRWSKKNESVVDDGSAGAWENNIPDVAADRSRPN